MKLQTIVPLKKSFNLSLTVPGSKSYTQRALVLASLATGISHLHNSLICEDTSLLIDALRQLGVKIQQTSQEIMVHGTGGIFSPQRNKILINIGNNGTAFRFLTALASLVPSTIHFTGSERMKQRPITPLVETLHSFGAHIITSSEANHSYFLTVQGGALKGGTCKLNSQQSSQFVSSLLMVLSYAQSPSTLLVSNKAISSSYIHLTLDCMKSFGVICEADADGYNISQKKYIATDYLIEPDVTSAGYFFAAAALCTSTVTIPLNLLTKQGDLHLVTLLEKMGCSVTKTNSAITLTGNYLKGITQDMGSLPDSVPTFAVVAAFAHGKTTLTNIEHLRYKECDRLNALETELKKVGVDVSTTKESITINGPPLKNIKPLTRSITVETYNDHRIAMSFAVLGLKTGIRLKNPECVAKSYPDFWKTFEKLYRG